VSVGPAEEGILSVWKSIGTFRSGRPLKPWLVRILVNKVQSYQRANSKIMLSLDTDLVADPVGDDPLKGIEQRDQLQNVLRNLPLEQRQVVLLRYFAELSLIETATVLGRSQGTIKSQIHRALEHLKDLIEDDNGK